MTGIRSAEVQQSLRGVGRFETDTFNAFREASFAGGSEITIYGFNFNANPGLNQIYFSTSALSSTTSITLTGPALSGKYLLRPASTSTSIDSC